MFCVSPLSCSWVFLFFSLLFCLCLFHRIFNTVQIYINEIRLRIKSQRHKTHCHVQIHECVYTYSYDKTINEREEKKHTENIEKEEANVIKLAHPFRLCSLLHTHTHTHVHPLLLAHQRHRHALTLRQPLRTIAQKSELERWWWSVAMNNYLFFLNNNKTKIHLFNWKFATRISRTNVCGHSSPKYLFSFRF